MQQDLFGQLTLILAVGAGISLIMRLIRQPLIIGYILTGVIVGPSLLHLVTSSETFEGFSNIGIALLLFIVGLGLNPRVIKELGKVSTVTAFTQMLFASAVGFAVMRILGGTTGEAVILGIALAFSSTIVGLKLLSDKKEQSRLYGRIAIGVLLVQDVIATLSLLFLSAHKKGFSFSSLGMLSLKGLAIAVPLFFFANKIMPKLTNFIAGSQEFLFLFALAWGFGIGAVFKGIGFSLEVGALMAGVSMASLPYAQEVAARLRPVRDFFIVVFFIFLGSRLGVEDILKVLPLASIFTALVLIVNPIIIMLPLGLFGHTKRNAFKVGVTMAQISEFSLIFAVLAQKQGIVNDETISMLTIISLLTIAVSCYLAIYADKIFDFLQKRIRFFEHTKEPKGERRQHFDIVLFGYRKGGAEFIKIFEQIGKRYTVVDYNPEVIDIMENQKLPYTYGDAADPELLNELNLEHVHLAISTMADHPTNLLLLDYMEKINSGAVVICHAESYNEAAELYEHGASYVMLPHYVGSEKIGAFIKRHGFNKTEFRKFREKHLQYLQEQLVSEKGEFSSTQIP